MPSRVMTPLLGSVALVVAFGVAQATGVRWLGGVVLVLAGAWCGARWWRATGPLRAIGAVVVYAVAFVVSHPLGKVLGPWPAVAAVAVAAGVVAWWVTPPVADRG